MSEYVIMLVVLGALLIGGLILWWTEPDDLETVRQRERAMQAMEKWSL